MNKQAIHKIAVIALSLLLGLGTLLSTVQADPQSFVANSSMANSMMANSGMSVDISGSSDSESCISCEPGDMDRGAVAMAMSCACIVSACVSLQAHSAAFSLASVDLKFTALDVYLLAQSRAIPEPFPPKSDILA